MTQEMTVWLLDRLNQDMTRRIRIAREAAGTLGGRVVIRLAMDQVAGIKSQRRFASKALCEGEGQRFRDILAWLAYAHETAPGYLQTWAPDEVDLSRRCGTTTSPTNQTT